jgi:hypothetical protein
MPDAPEPTVSVTLELSQRVADLLTVLTIGDYAPGDLHGVLMELIDHAQQGVYRPGAWERSWLTQAFGDDWLDGLEPDTENTAGDGRVVFQRPVQPIKPCPNDPPCPHDQFEHETDSAGAFCLAQDCKCGDDPEEASDGT